MNNYRLINIIYEFIRSIYNINIFIDFIIISENICVYDFGILSVCNVFSDYWVIYIYIYQKININIVYKCKIWDYKYVDMEFLNKFIFECDWCRIIDDIDNIDKVIINFINKFFFFIYYCIFEKIVIIRLNDKLWMDFFFRKIL